MTDSAFNESPETYKARKELKRILENDDYTVEEEVPLADVTNNMEEETYPPYRADMVVTKTFIIELDPQSSKKYKSKGHGTRRRRIHDQWRDINIRSQAKLKTVRLKPEDILNYDESMTLHEIEHQLRHQI
jgi:predicted RND superfamily exporter protein